MNKFIKFLSLTILFLFPFQTRWIYEPAFLGGKYFEWFSASLYGVEILIWIVIIFTFFRLFFEKTFWLSINLSQNKKDKIMKIVRPFVFLILLTIYLFVVPLNRDLAEYKIFLLLGTLCFALTLLINRISVWSMMIVIWSGGIVQAYLAIIQFVFQRTWGNKWLGLAQHFPSDLGTAVLQTADGGRWLRAYGSFNWPNDLGIYLAIVFIIGLFLCEYFLKNRERIFLSIGQLIIVAGLSFSFSRAAFVALFFGLIVWLVLGKGKNAKSLIAPLSLILMLFVICLPMWQSRIIAENRLETRAIGERFEQYKDFLEIFLAHPIFGVGPGNYIYALFNQKLILNSFVYQPVHNVFLLFLAEWGIIGFICMLIMAFYFFKEVWKSNKKMISIWIVVLTFFLFDHYLYTGYSGLILVFTILILSLKKPVFDQL